MHTIELNNILLDELDFIDAPGFQTALSWPNDRPIPHVTGAYFIQGNPVIYFSQLEEIDIYTLAQLYRNVWSQSKAALLYVTTQQDILIYNLYANPPQSDTPDEILPDNLVYQDRLIKHLQSLNTIEAARRAITEELKDYKRMYLDVGAFWQTQDGQRIDREKRADQHLLKASDQLRRHLLQLLEPVLHAAKATEVAYALLGRCIFIRYLEDRGILPQDWVADRTKGQAQNYLIALDNRVVTYQLFDYLQQRFNGDIFSVEKEERETVNEQHLSLIKAFLQEQKLDNGQLSCRPYNFSYVPVELISNIYDTFLGKDARKTIVTYAMPLALVDFVIEETLPLEKTRPDMTVLDPACGSGVFLVKAYQRLIEAWKQQHPDQPVSTHLASIMQESIFGIDVQRNAIKVAAFNLCLSMLGYLKNEEINAANFQFPKLENTNLMHADFFSEQIDSLFVDKHFDRVVGNPSRNAGTLTTHAEFWLSQHGYTSDRIQLVQAFLLRAPIFCATDGEIAMLAPTRSTIIVNSPPHQHFTQKFFTSHHVRAVVNFSAFAHELFVPPGAVTALFYSQRTPTVSNKIIYAVPKPTAYSRSSGFVVLDTSDIKRLEQAELLSNPLLWKIAQWGTPRDEAFINHLRTLPTLEQQRKHLHWREIQEGFVTGKDEERKQDAYWLQDKPFVGSKDFQPYTVEAHDTVWGYRFEHPRDESAYTAPLVLIRRSSCEAALLEEGFAAYPDAITGVPGRAGQEYLLKWLTIYMNSALARYYHFLTSSRWAVERDIDSGTRDEYKRMPFLIPNEDNPKLQEVLSLFEHIVELYRKNGNTYQERDKIVNGRYRNAIEGVKTQIDNLVFDLYDVSAIERQLVRDTVKYELEFFEQLRRRRHEINAIPVERPTKQMLIEYAQAFIEIVTLFLRYQSQTFNATIYQHIQDNVPFNIIEFELADSEHAREVRYVAEDRALRELLRQLDHRLREQYHSTIYVRRHVRIYDGSHFHLVRPDECRLWTQSQAYADADSFIAEMLGRSHKAAMGVTFEPARSGT